MQRDSWSRAGRGPAEVVPGRVLVVDDEAIIHVAVSRTLARSFDVRWAPSVRTALQLIEVEPDFDVVLCDLNMYPGTGLQLFATLRARAPHLLPRFGFMTGCTPDDAALIRATETGRPVLRKPFAAVSLSRLVGALALGESEGPL